jgi:L-amino acid N-acyltransferase YncA
VKQDDCEEYVPIAVARCFRDEDEKDLAEVALVTADEWQGAGAGAELMRSLSAAAVKAGIRRWVAAMFTDNTAIHHLLNRFGKRCDQRDLGNGVVEVIYEIVQPSDDALS